MEPVSEDVAAEREEEEEGDQQKYTGQRANGSITSLPSIPPLADKDRDSLKDSDGLKLRLELDLDVEIELKARLKGEVVLALLA